MTLIELVMAIVIISVGLVGVMLAFTTVVRGSSDPLIHKQMLAIAEEMMEELTLKPYAPVAPLAVPINACARNTFNDIVDYNGYSAAAICDVDGTAVAALASYSITVSVADDAATLPGVAAKKITVNVTHGGETMTLLGWRTGYAL